MNAGLRPDHVIADVGSGTGILSKLFLENGNRVFAVEPNDEMRRAGEEYLSGFKKFSSVAGSAEATTLADASVDFVTVAQAFHWFEPVAARREFHESCAGGIGGDRLERTIVGYHAVFARLRGVAASLWQATMPRSARAIRGKRKFRHFFAECLSLKKAFRIFRSLISTALAGRVRSSSYVPQEGHANFAPMMAALRKFLTHHQSGASAHGIRDASLFWPA